MPTSLPDKPKPRPILRSPCHVHRLSVVRADGVWVGHCDGCNAECVRMNPRTGLFEWLDGQSPWTSQELRPVADEYQNPAVLAFLPVFGLRSPCHGQPVAFQDYMGRARVGVCTTCNDIFARVNRVTNRIERVASEDEILSPNGLTEFSDDFQPRW